MICRSEGCRTLCQEGSLGYKHGLCIKCWEEITALEDMKKAKREKKDKQGPPLDCLPVFA